MANITARLRDARFSQTYQGDRILIGKVYDDQHQRWLNGEEVATSIVIDEIEPNVFKTRAKTVFQVENWA